MHRYGLVTARALVQSDVKSMMCMSVCLIQMSHSVTVRKTRTLRCLNQWILLALLCAVKKCAM